MQATKHNLWWRLHDPDFVLSADVLAEMPRLPKRHYAFGLAMTRLDNDERLATELARVLGTVQIDAADTQAKRIKKQVEIAKQANAVFGVTFQPWHAALTKYPDIAKTPPLPGSEAWTYEMGLLNKRAEAIHRAIGGDVPIGQIDCDTEIWRVLSAEGKPADSGYRWDMLTALDAYDAELRRLFPDARIVWYGRGKAFWGPGFEAIHWPYWTGRERTDCLSPYLYTIGNIHQTRRLLDLHEGPIVPYVALGCGYPRPFPAGTNPEWDWKWDYDLTASYLLGSMLARDDRVEAVILYPHPYDDRAPAWGKHFVAYCLGEMEVSQ